MKRAIIRPPEEGSCSINAAAESVLGNLTGSMHSNWLRQKHCLLAWELAEEI